MIPYWAMHFEKLVAENPLIALLLSFWAGVLASFTPCTYPVIPLTVAFLGHHISGSKGSSILVSFAYATGLATVYTALGVMAATTGIIFGSWAGNYVLYIAVGNVCLLAALVMLDVIQLPIPSFMTSLTSKSSVKASNILGAFTMGATSALIIGPCTTPVPGALLALAASGKNIMRATLFFLAFSYGLSFLVILAGLFGGVLAKLPKSGQWLLKIQRFFALIMIVVAEYFLIKAGRMVGH